jgi:hypothetical protein
MNERKILNWILQKSSANCELDFSGSGLFISMGEHGNYSSGSIKAEDILTS